MDIQTQKLQLVQRILEIDSQEEIDKLFQALEKEGNKTKKLREALEQGEKSDEAENFNPDEHLMHLHKKYK